MTLFNIDDPMFVTVKDLERARRWYCEKLDCQAFPGYKNEPGEIILQLGNGSLVIGLADPETAGSLEAGPIDVISTHNIEKAHRLLESRGVVVGPIVRNDRTGARFEFRDADDNLLEILEDS
jgi:catechol 2,3-dioxygenase-like lactoylglutathione lyase family enzyme